MEKLAIEYIDIDTLTPYEGNAKEHTEEQVDQIIASIKEFGMEDPIAVSGDNNLVIEGHGRLLALKKMGEKQAPIIRLDHLTDEQRRAYTLVHNRLTMNTGFDTKALDIELTSLDRGLEEYGFDGVYGFGWDREEVERSSSTEEKDGLRCPKCGFVDYKENFKEVQAGEKTDDTES